MHLVEVVGYLEGLVLNEADDYRMEDGRRRKIQSISGGQGCELETNCASMRISRKIRNTLFFWSKFMHFPFFLGCFGPF